MNLRQFEVLNSGAPHPELAAVKFPVIVAGFVDESGHVRVRCNEFVQHGGVRNTRDDLYFIFNPLLGEVVSYE